MSDSESGTYIQTVTQLIQNEKSVSGFRRNFEYRRVLEHVDWSLCKQYLSRIDELSPGNKKALMQSHKPNDFFGSPHRFLISRSDWMAATTIRYISVLMEICSITPVSEQMRIVEIGVGYGGQAAIFNREFGIRDYSMFDLQPVHNLVIQYLKGIDSPLVPEFLDINSDFNRSWDLVISNYAFSELPSRLQTEYVVKVLKQANHGYLIMNSGRTNKTGRSNGKLSLDEILQQLPHAEVREEKPLSGPDNYVLVW